MQRNEAAAAIINGGKGSCTDSSPHAFVQPSRWL
jgi:hypothetical protein